MDRLLTFFGVEYDKDEVERDVFPLGTAPFVRLVVDAEEGGRRALMSEDAMFWPAARFRDGAALRSAHLQRFWSSVNS